MEEEAKALQKIMLDLTSVETSILKSDQAQKKVAAVTFALERIGQAKMLIGRAQANLFGEVAKERGVDPEPFLLDAGPTAAGPGTSGHHALVHDPFDED